LALHQQAADQRGGDDLGGAGEEGWWGLEGAGRGLWRAEEWLGGEIVHRIESISCLRYFDKESTAALRR